MNRLRRRAPARAGLAALLGSSAGLVAGCLSVGREFPVAPVAEIRLHETTRAEVERMFGEPWRTGLDDGLRTWTYGHYRYALLGETKTRDLVVRFDDEGRVVSYTFNSTRPEDRGLSR